MHKAKEVSCGYCRTINDFYHKSLNKKAIKLKTSGISKPSGADGVETLLKL